MAKFLLGLSLALILATAVLSYKTQERIVLLQADLLAKNKDLKTTRATLEKRTEELRVMTADRDEARATIVERDKEIRELKAKISALETELATTKTDLETRTKELAAKTAEFEELKASIPPTDGQQTLKEVIEKLKKDLETASQELAESKQAFATLEQQKKEVDGKLTAAQNQVSAYKFSIVKTGLSGKILAYNPGWNFVVLSIGDKQGVKANTQMLVMRSGQPIAKVKISSVEPGTSIGDVIPGSLAKGQMVQPGDTVVYEARN